MNTTEETMGAQHRPRIMLADKPLVKISLEISVNEKEDINRQILRQNADEKRWVKLA
jgi:hypothetical protein